MELPALHKLKKIHLLMLALAHPTKRQIITILHTQPKLSVQELVTLLTLEQAIVSHNLATLRRYHILDTHKQGRQVYYTLNKKVLEKLSEDIKNFAI